MTRKNLPSASGTMRLLNCLGSPALESSMPPEPETPDAVRDGGTLIHAAICGDLEALARLTPEQIETKEACERLEHEHASKYIDDAPHDLTREIRLWMFDEEMNQIFSGQPDVIRIQPARRVAVVTDFKSGWLGAEPADQNAQIMALAVLVATHFDVETVYGIIVQPNAGPRVSVVEYGPAELAQAEKTLRAALTKARQPDAPRSAGEWCKFCRAKAACPEGKARVSAVTVYGAQPASLRPMTPAQRTQILDMCVQAEFFIAAWRKEAKEIEKETPGSLGEWTLGKSRNIPSVDTAQAWNALSAHMAPAEFIDCCKVSITGLRNTYQKAVKAKGGKCTGDEAKRAVNDILGDAVTYNQTERSLERV